MRVRVSINLCILTELDGDPFTAQQVNNYYKA